MKRRCSPNPNNADKSNYYDRGIKVCDRWINDYDAFFQDMGECPLNHSLDRVDNNGHYEPKNCRWATRSDQQRNKRTNVFIEHHGERKTIAEWSQITGIEESVIKRRLTKGYDSEKIFSLQRVNKWRHATTTAYLYHKCRCKKCIKFMKQYRIKTKKVDFNANRESEVV